MPNGDVTRLLEQVAAGGERAEEAKNELFMHVYQELLEMARRRMRLERRDHSWGATDLVHEAYLKLFKGTAPTKNRAYFFGAAVRAMRQLLITHAREPRLPRLPIDGRPGVLDDLLDNLE